MHTQNIRSKNLAWIISTVILLAGFCIVLFLMFEPSIAHAQVGDWALKKLKAFGDASEKTFNAVLHPIETSKTLLKTAADQVFGRLFELIGHFVFLITGIFFSMASWLLDAAIAQTLDSGLLKNLPAIKDGWGIVRDVANMFFIFILLYIAIATILQLSKFDWKKTLGKLIIAALLINFSLFFTKVIIDASNIFATMFYNGMTTTINGEVIYGPATILKERTGIDSIFESIDAKKVAGDPEKRLKLNHLSRGMIWFGGAIFRIIATFVFLAGAIIFVKRTISLIFLMILSPIAFIGFILPSTEKYSKEWWGALTSNALVAPVFLFMLYLVTLIVQGTNLESMTGSENTSLAAAFVGRGGNYAIILHFMILIGLMWGALVISQKVCESAAKGAVNFARKGIRGTGRAAASGMVAGTVAGGAATARYGHEKLYRDSKMRSNVREKLYSQSQKGGVGGWAARKGLNLDSKLDTSSFDPRQTKLGSAALAGTLGKAGIKTDLGKDLGKGGIKAKEEKRIKETAIHAGMLEKSDVFTQLGKKGAVLPGFEKIKRQENEARGFEARALNAKSPREKKHYEEVAKEIRKNLRVDTQKEKAELREAKKEKDETKKEERASRVQGVERDLSSELKKQHVDFDKIAHGMGQLSKQDIKDFEDKSLFSNPEIAVHLDVGHIKELQNTLTKDEKTSIRATIENVAGGVISQNKQGQGIVPTDAQKQSVKKTAMWLNSAHGGNEF